MEKDTVLLLFENVLDRIIKDEDTKKYVLTGVLSDKEMTALRHVHEYLGGENNGITAHTPDTEEIIQPISAFPLVTDSLEFSEPQDKETILCLDFGTAMSKAFASNQDDLILYELAIGERAGQTSPLFSVVSSIYINEESKVLFGEPAVIESLNGDIEASKRIDSIKDMICKDVIRDLDSVPVEDEFNPTEHKFTKGDIVTLYLAYLTDMACSELVEKHNSSRYVSRRFTRPVLPQERAPWAEEQLTKLLARAQILADTLHDNWNSGIDAGRLKATLDAIRKLEELPMYLIDKPVLEPVAAVASRTRNFDASENKRRLMLIVDVGAGTIDYALFVEIEKIGKGIKVFEVPNSIYVLRQAGDAVDKALRRYVLKKADISSGDTDYHLINASLSQTIRRDKEELFRIGSKTFILEDDHEVTITLSDFTNSPSMKELEKAIHAKFNELLLGVDPSYITELKNNGLVIVFTGGGSQLPIVRSLADKQITIHDSLINCIGATAIPAWIEQEYPELREEYPPLAVSIGGCSRELPEHAPISFEAFGGEDPGKGGWTIPPAYKGA